ncbi:hypothetical protein ASH00_08990 [Arthrobacter sp. Soil782]|uniref:hypothetical protein n=1 Tax=Arthrobacter sp. Soil782 TaxID=1736410 RepID=UPI0006F58559|nr:hypothetical protein [Arthrobacter sp. Soil782]KRF05592.1 hypothetical protein ASH00_08990 [Arthrobacter sp. Soil782]
MNKLASIALLSALLLVTGCGADAAPSAESTSSSPSATPTTKKATPKPTPTRSATPTPTPTPSPTPEAAQFKYSCYSEAESSIETYYTFQAAWDVAYDNCEVNQTGGEVLDNDRKALEVAYGPDAEEDSLKYLYGICASTVGIPVDDIVSTGQADEAAGAILLCPEHPKVAQIQANIEKARAAGREQEAIEADRATGKFVTSGSYLIGSEAQPGTWQSQGPKVEDCYWEVSDASGNILANNFISVAPQFTIVVPADAAGFTVEGCAFRWIGG